MAEFKIRTDLAVELKDRVKSNRDIEGISIDEEYLERILENLNNKKMFKPFIDEGIKYLKGELN